MNLKNKKDTDNSEEIEQKVEIIENFGERKEKYHIKPNINYEKKDKNELSDIKIEDAFQNPERNRNNNFEVNNVIQDNTEEMAKFKVPTSLKKTFFCSTILFAIGITLIVLGSIQQIAAADPGKGITFWVLGSIILIPGGYYTYQFYKARRARSYDERHEILDEIPEL